jgi:hypothetical protein
MDNPYQPPSSQPFIPTRPNSQGGRPVQASVIAILGLIYSSLGLMCNPLNAVGNLVIDPELGPEADLIERLAQTPTYRTGLVVFSVIGFVCCVLLLIASIGLLSGKRWGRQLGLTYGAVSLTATVASLFFGVVQYVMPIVSAAAESPDAQEQIRLYGGSVGAMGVLVAPLAFPIALLLILNHPKVAATYG